jgi:hypothetical protein
VNAKPVGVLNVNGYYDHMLRFIDHAVAEDFVPHRVKAQIVVDHDPERLLHKMTLS